MGASLFGLYIFYWKPNKVGLLQASLRYGFFNAKEAGVKKS
jgi:hypothetical protein